MYTLQGFRKHRSFLGQYPTFEEAVHAALHWWAEVSGEDLEDITGTWIETYDHDKSLRLWVLLPNFDLMQDHRWRIPTCEIRWVA